MRILLRFLPTVLVAFCFLPGYYLGHFFTGPAPSLFNRLLLGIPCAWLLAMLLGSASLFFTRMRPERQRILVLTISSIILFFPLRGLSRGLAEELELRERIRSGYQSDEGIAKMYGEMSGMGDVNGLIHWPSIIGFWSLGSVMTSPIWLPLAVWFSRSTSRIHPSSRVT